MHRRQFLQTGLAASAFSTLPILPALARTRPYRLALIGTGWWGMNILREAMAYGNVKVVGLVDVDQMHLIQAQTEVQKLKGDKAKIFEDYREMLQKTRPEIVIIGTPDHWHALNAIHALEAGAHVYLEKPISHTLDEGLAILQTARRVGKKVQVGTHRRVSPHNIAAIDFLKAGKAGQVHSVKCFVNYAGNPRLPARPTEVPVSLNWDLWCGPAPVNPFNSQIHPKGWRMFLDYANGHIADWGIHWFDQVLWWTEELHPKKVFSTGGRYLQTDSSDAPDTQYALYEFETFTLQWENKRLAPNANESANVGCYFYGTEGTLHLGWRDGWTFYPRDKKKEPVNYPASLLDSLYKVRPEFGNILPVRLVEASGIIDRLLLFVPGIKGPAI
ncbi:MAG: Gfo/Idh/MocA family oxidoreductase, partial [Bacteroidota bacterium]